MEVGAGMSAFMEWADGADGAAQDLEKGAAVFVAWNNDPLVVSCLLLQVAIRALCLCLAPLGSSCDFYGARWRPQVVLLHEFASRVCSLVWIVFWWQVRSAILSPTCASRKHALTS